MIEAIELTCWEGSSDMHVRAKTLWPMTIDAHCLDFSHDALFLKEYRLSCDRQFNRYQRHPYADSPKDSSSELLNHGVSV